MFVKDGVDLSKPTNAEFLSRAFGKSMTNYDIKVDLIIRGCINGEGLRENGACY